MEYNNLVEMGIKEIVNWKWHKIISADAGETRENFLKDICARTPIIANYGNNMCSGIYIKNEGLPDPKKHEIDAYALEIVAQDYYRLLIIKSIFCEIIQQISDINVLKNFFDIMKRKFSFEGSSLKDLLDALDTSTEMVKSSYMEMINTGTMTNVYIGNLPVTIYDVQSVIDYFHRSLGNDYSNFALIFDTDKNLSTLSKKAINDYIFSRTMGYKINVVCERKEKIVSDFIDQNEKRTIYLPDWMGSTFNGSFIENPHDYSHRDYTDELRLVKTK